MIIVLIVLVLLCNVLFFALGFCVAINYATKMILKIKERNGYNCADYIKEE